MRFAALLLALLPFGEGANADILEAIRFVECGDVETPPDGDNGNAIGHYQIWHVYWFDAVEFDSTIGGSYEDCRSRKYAEKVVAAYMNRYCRDAWAKGDAERIARVHNGGPRGHKKESTLKYWRKVQRKLEGKQ